MEVRTKCFKPATCMRSSSVMPSSSCMAEWLVWVIQKGTGGSYTLLSFMNSSGRSVSSLSLALMITSPSVACKSILIGLHCQPPASREPVLLHLQGLGCGSLGHSLAPPVGCAPSNPQTVSQGLRCSRTQLSTTVKGVKTREMYQAMMQAEWPT